MTRTVGASFREAYAESLASLSFNLTGLLAGGLLSIYFGLFKEYSWAFILYPGILSVRGAIGGLFSGRVSTGLHLGLVKPTVRDNTEYAYTLFQTVMAIALISSVFMSTLGSLFSVAQGAAALQDILRIFIVVTATMLLSVVLIPPFTYAVSVYSYRKGLDPDKVVYPIISTVSDIIVTACYVVVIKGTVSWGRLGWAVFALLDAAFIGVVIYIIDRNRENRDFVDTVKQFLVTLAIVSVIVNITGSALERITGTIGKRPEIYMVYPALIDTVGDAGSIVGCTATTKMLLGTLSPRLTAIREHTQEILSTWLASLTMFIVYAVASSIVYGVHLVSGLALRLILVNVVLIPVIVVVAMATAIVTTRRGLNPDNFVIPIETSISDGLTTLVLYAALTLIR
ncbi:magnesium transporter [Candidatus Bathyarchaeota archaeon]|nr:magnesium transporter [Candidatus Bathyarchaeota archaeon]